MWKFVLLLDVLILALLWMLSMVAITPAHNLLVLYAEQDLVLPLLTDYAIQARSMTGALPLVWAILTLPMGKWLATQTESRRLEGLMLHAAVSLLLGLALLFVYGLAGILPILKIGASLS